VTKKLKKMSKISDKKSENFDTIWKIRDPEKSKKSEKSGNFEKNSGKYFRKFSKILENFEKKIRKF